MNLRSLQHVSTPYPPGRRDEVRAFYTEALGLTEIPVPHTLRAGLVWYTVGDGLELHFYPGELAPGSERHFCLDVEDLDATRAQLAGAGVEPYDTTPIPNRPRFFCRDPFGNLVEFTTIQGSYLAD
jgi:catechol 2,3-dioxygenase-like lactoylglutathione lyase family enzyme